MTIFSQEKTTAAILEKFSLLSDYEKRKIVFWYDRDQTAEEEDLASIRTALQQHGIKMHLLKNNFFETKKLLEHDDTESHYLIYSPEAERPYEENWLLDIQLYSGRFETSWISDLKTEIGIDSYDLDSFLETHQKFFANKVRVAAFKKLYQNTWKEDDLLLGIFAVLTSSSVVDEKQILRNLLMNSLTEEENTIWEDIVRYNLADAFWEMAGRQFGYYTKYPTLKKLFLSFIITHIDRNAELSLGTLKQYVNRRRQSNECEIFISGWMDNTKDASMFDDYCNDLFHEDDNNLEKILTSILTKSRVECYLEVECPEIVDKSVIRSIVSTITEGGSDYEKYLTWIDARKTKHCYPKFVNIYLALRYAIELIRLSEETEEQGIREESMNGLFSAYRDTYYLLDFYYRKFYFHYDKDSDKDILKNNIQEIVEREYHRINEKIMMRWSDLIESGAGGRWGVELIDNESDFFNTHVAKIIHRNDRDKVAVIISDAMRYEVAAELRDVLNTSTNGTIEISTMTGCLPSYTRLGMASLLPHTNLEYHNDHVIVDGTDADGLANREKILRTEEEESIVFNFNDLRNLKTEEARELLKGKKIVYIYHNRIDETGDNHSSQDSVFAAADDAIHEIDEMINRLSRSLNISNIFITADHGFLYTRDALESADLVEMDGFDREQILISNKRFIISSEKTELPNTHRFDMELSSDSQKPLFIYTPYADLRFRLKGGGRNFVHGGAALQEIVIPVLYYNHNKSVSALDKKGIEHGTVGITVIEQLKKITSNPFKLRLLQTENVTDKRIPLTCKIALYDTAGTRVSDEKTVIADKTSDEPNERILDVMLTLGGNVKNGIYLLKAFNDDPKVLCRDLFEIPVEVDILITDDF